MNDNIEELIKALRDFVEHNAEDKYDMTRSGYERKEALVAALKKVLEDECESHNS
jgi:ABC-type transporter lipoprotein component MlaA